MPAMVKQTGRISLEKTVASLMRKNHKTISVAESCSGGLLAAKLTSVPGSSNFFKQGLIVYSNESKIILLGIPQNLINREGAVSRTVARIMAEHIRHKAQTDYGISITGIAGPGGATKKKKVGLVYIGIAAPNLSHVEEFHFKGNRDAIRTSSVMHALNLLHKELINGKEN